ncbi:MAG: OmpH family outer membrane protein [Dysgonamonadaceae bacterium]|jgi:outer membrane protein|nr:OmpH family outer membrane protein [Dysgonamonadaceae bacterium]
MKKFMMPKKLLILLFAIAPLSMSIAAQETKIAYINSQEIFNAMPEIPDIEKQLSDKQEEIKKNASALETEYNAKLEEFSKVGTNISDAVKQDQQRQLEQISERYQMYIQNSQKEAQELYQKLVGPVNQKIQDAIKSVGDENGFTYILDIATPSSPIVYVSDSAIDATKMVKTKLGIN